MTERTASRLAWSLWAVAVALSAASLALLVWNRGESARGTYGPPGFVAVFALVFGTVGALVASRRPGNAIGWIFLAVGVASGVQELGQQYAVRGLLVDPGSLPGAEWAAWVGEWIWVPLTGSILIFLLLLFPTGAVASVRWRLAGWIGAGGIALASTGFALQPRLESFDRIANPLPLLTPAAGPMSEGGMLLYLFGVVGAVASLVSRFRRATGEERAQLRWIVAAGAVTAAALALSVPTQLARVGGVAGELLELLVIAGFLSIPVAAGIAILKYRLYDIDLVINKAVLYGVLVAVATGIYVAVVVGIGALVGRRGSFALSILATAIIALAFHPLRERARHLADRLVYGRRATPYEVLSEFSDRLGATYSLEDVLPRTAAVLAEGTGAAGVQVWLRVGGELRLAASWPEQPRGDAVPLAWDDLPELEGAGRVAPVRHQGELLGAIALRKPPNEPLTPAEARLVDDLASQTALVLRNVRLVEDLRASRQRLVRAQDEERRRLERNIHDGAQQQLVALAVKLRLAETLADRDAAKTREMLAQAKSEAHDALETLRDLARGIYPPLLADQGLPAALEAQARKTAVPVEVLADGVGRYPQEVEAAVYFCVLEALQNVAKYARAGRVEVRLTTEDGQLRFEVADDGVGFDPEQAARGAGLQNMADRVDALGGAVEVRSSPGAGTVVAGRVPANEASR